MLELSLLLESGFSCCLFNSNLICKLFYFSLSFFLVVVAVAGNGIGSVCAALVLVRRLLQAEDLQSQNGLCPQVICFHKATRQDNCQSAREDKVWYPGLGAAS